ncbi:hypothetical protein LC653_28925 [Nostoc sp. CHAB 5784]|nr:hypothetical protein [Nostoc mirabile CHAB5784]
MVADRTVGSLILLTGAIGRCLRRAGTLSLLGSGGIAGAMQKAVNYAPKAILTRLISRGKLRPIIPHP